MTSWSQLTDYLGSRLDDIIEGEGRPIPEGVAAHVEYAVIDRRGPKDVRVEDAERHGSRIWTAHWSLPRVADDVDPIHRYLIFAVTAEGSLVELEEAVAGTAEFWVGAETEARYERLLVARRPLDLTGNWYEDISDWLGENFRIAYHRASQLERSQLRASRPTRWQSEGEEG